MKKKFYVSFALIMLLSVVALPMDISVGTVGLGGGSGVSTAHSSIPNALSTTQLVIPLERIGDAFTFRRWGDGAASTLEEAIRETLDMFHNYPYYDDFDEYTPYSYLMASGGFANAGGVGTPPTYYGAFLAYSRSLAYANTSVIPDDYFVRSAYLCLHQYCSFKNNTRIVVEASSVPPTAPHAREVFAYSGNFAGENNTANAPYPYDLIIQLNLGLINNTGNTYFLFKAWNEYEDIIPRYDGENDQLNWWTGDLYVETCPFGIDGAFQPVQVVWQDDPTYGDNMKRLGFGVWNACLPMVQGKNTLLFGYPWKDSGTIRFTVTNNYKVQKSFTLKLRVMPDNNVIYESNVFNAPPGQTVIYLSAPIPSKDNPFQFINDGPATIEVEVVPAAGSEPIESNKVIVHVNVKHTRSLSILYIGIRFPWDPTPPTVNMKRATDFILGTYPIAESDIISYTDPAEQILRWMQVQELHQNGQLNKKPWNETILAWALKYYSRYEWFGKRMDRVVLVVPNGWQTNFGSGSWTGLSIPSTTEGAVFVVQDYLTTVAHEIGHTYNLPVTQNSPGEEYSDIVTGNFAHGYWVNEKVEKGPGTYCFMSARTHPPQSLDRWVCTPDYERLISREFNLTADPEVLGVSGLIFRNNSVVFDPCYRIPQASPDLEAGETGNYSIVLLDNAGTALSRTGFNATFMMEMGDTMEMSETDVVPFAFRVLWMTNTSRIEIRDATDHTLATRIVSANPPSVTITSPNGGEILTPPQNYTITWNASDTDGDPLTYTLLYSNDNGTSWLPLAIDYRETSYVWNVTGLPGGNNYLVKVIASDGVNTGEDLSNGIFTIVAPVHDVAIVSITFSKQNPALGETFDIYVTVENRGNLAETFDVNVNYTLLGEPLIGTQTVTLEPGAMITLNFTWTPDTTGRYEIKAYTSAILEDTNPSDNTKITYFYVTSGIRRRGGAGRWAVLR